jgi:hypothetical protein
MPRCECGRGAWLALALARWVFKTPAILEPTTLLLATLALTATLRAAETYDLVVYGGTSGAVAAAVQVKKMGKTVVVVSPDKHLGGLSAGLLDATNGVVAFYLAFGMNPVQVLQFIASGALGQAAFEGGLATAALGMEFHFLIAVVAAAVFVVAASALDGRDRSSGATAAIV